MATLTLKNVPDDLVAKLKAEARRNRRSLNQETLKRLETSLTTQPRSGKVVVASLRRFHRHLGDLPPLTDELLERAKREGRP